MHNTFWEDIVEKCKEGILLLVKYGLIIAFILFAFKYFLEVQQMAQNGQQAAVMIIELQKKGYLPTVVNGNIPDRPIVKVEEKVK